MCDKRDKVRVSLFADPNVMVVYVPDGQVTPPLFPPFTMDNLTEQATSQELRIRIGKVAPREHDRAARQLAQDVKSSRKQWHIQKEAAEAHILKGSSNDDRSALVLRRHEVDSDIALLKADIAAARTRAHSKGVYMPRDKYLKKEARLLGLQQETQAIQMRLGNIRRSREGGRAGRFMKASFAVLDEDTLSMVHAAMEEYE